MTTHGKARDLTIAALRRREPFRRSGFAMTGIEGSSYGTGRLPEKEAEQYRMDSWEGILYTVLSYNTPIGWVKKDGEVVIPNIKYSSTTSNHQGLVKVFL